MSNGCYACARVFPGPGEHARPADNDQGREDTRCRTTNVAQYATKTHAIVFGLSRLRHLVHSLMVRSYCLGNYLSLLFGMAMASAHAAAQVNACDEYAVVVLGHARVNIDSFIIRKVAMGIDFHTAATGTKTKPNHPPKCTISTTYFTLVKLET